ncbi:MAG: RNA 2',3'-cyclic phosphodiesterase [Thermoplasmata archaeon]
MRAFVAVEVPPIGGPAEGGGSAPEHLTLLFLGEVRAERVGPITERLEEVARGHAPFDVRIEGVGAFPSADAPRVLWIGSTLGTAELIGLAGKVREALRGEGTATPEQTFVPHVTWFRVRSAESRRAAVDLLRGRRPVPPPRQTRIEEFVLKESLLSARGAVHRTVAVFRLGGRGSPDDIADPLARSSTSFRQR